MTEGSRYDLAYSVKETRRDARIVDTNRYIYLLCSSEHTYCGHSLVGKARPCQGRDRGFESRCPLEGSELMSTFMVG